MSMLYTVKGHHGHWQNNKVDFCIDVIITVASSTNFYSIRKVKACEMLQK